LGSLIAGLAEVAIKFCGDVIEANPTIGFVSPGEFQGMASGTNFLSLAATVVPSRIPLDKPSRY
jgi:hypothetical protein